MSSAGVAAQEIRVPLKSGFLHDGQALGSVKACWGSRREFEKNLLNIHPISTGYSLNSPGQGHLAPLGRTASPAPMNGHRFADRGPRRKPSLPPLIIPAGENVGAHDEDRVLGGFKKLSVSAGCAASPPLTPGRACASPSPCPCPCPCAALCERRARPLPPLPVPQARAPDAADCDCEVEFLTCSDTALLLGGRALCGRRSFRGCGQVNYAYFESPAPSLLDLHQAPGPSGGGHDPIPDLDPDPDLDPAPSQAHRRLRRSHSGPAGSLNKAAARGAGHPHRASPNSDDEKPEVPPRVPIPPRPVKPDYRRWSAEVASSTYSDEDRPPKVPPREPLSRSSSRTPSPKSLPSYLNGVMPPTQSFAPDPKYTSPKALQRQNSEGSANKAPCILPIIENGKKVSSTHYYLLPERPPYLDRYEKFFQEAEEADVGTHVQALPAADGLGPPAADKPGPKARAAPGGQGKRKHSSCVVSP